MRRRKVRRHGHCTSKLDAFKATIAEWLEKDTTVSGAVIEQRLRPLGYTYRRIYHLTRLPETKPCAHKQAQSRFHSHGASARRARSEVGQRPSAC